MTKPLSPAQAVLTAVTQQEYCLDPSDIPNEAARIGRLAAAALRAVANHWRVDTEFIGGVEYIRTITLEMIAAELEANAIPIPEIALEHLAEQ